MQVLHIYQKRLVNIGLITVINCNIQNLLKKKAKETISL